MKGKAKIQKTERILSRLMDTVRGHKLCVIGDWNAHHPTWSRKWQVQDGNETGVGNTMMEEGLELAEGDGVT